MTYNVWLATSGMCPEKVKKISSFKMLEEASAYIEKELHALDDMNSRGYVIPIYAVTRVWRSYYYAKSYIVIPEKEEL